MYGVQIHVFLFVNPHYMTLSSLPPNHSSKFARDNAKWSADFINKRLLYQFFDLSQWCGKRRRIGKCITKIVHKSAYYQHQIVKKLDFARLGWSQFFCALGSTRAGSCARWLKFTWHCLGVLQLEPEVCKSRYESTFYLKWCNIQTAHKSALMFQHSANAISIELQTKQSRHSKNAHIHILLVINVKLISRNWMLYKVWK